MSNRLSILAKRIRDRPQQKQLEARFNQLQKIAEDIRECLEQVSAARARAMALRAVESSTSLDEVVNKQMAVVRKRTDALSKATQSIQIRENAEVSAPLQDVRGAARLLQDAIIKEWNRVSSDLLEQASAFLEIAKQYDDVAANQLGTAKVRFSELTATPPTSVAEIDRYKAARQNLLKARDDLNLDGPTGVFLQACMDVNVGGDPRGLEKPEIRTFLDKHPILWKRLRLRLT